MALQSNQPDNKSFLSPIGFQFAIQRLPNVTYFCTKSGIPDITMGQIDTIENTFIKLPTPGDKLTFGVLDITFRVDEDMKNYMEIYDWLIGLGFPDNFNQRAAIGAKTAYGTGDVYSDASMLIMTGANVPNVEVKYIDLYPISITALEFDIESTDVEYMSATASFAYRKFELTAVT
jgi:hypothetical protein